MRGLLAEYGVVIARSADRFLAALPKLSEDSRLPDPVRALLLEVREQFAALHARLARCDAQIAAHARNSSAARRASELLGVGPITSSALVATLPDARVFKSGRQLGAWLGLAPRQHSSGGKTRLGRISLRGNVYLRTLLIQGARSTLQSAINTEPSRASRLQRWIIELYARKGYYKTLIAIANKHARMLWVMLAKDQGYDAAAWQRHPMHQPPLAGNA
jgi:transposase